MYFFTVFQYSDSESKQEQLKTNIVCLIILFYPGRQTVTSARSIYNIK